MPGNSHQPNNRSAHTLKWAGRLLVLTGVVMLAWYAFTVGNMYRSEERARDSFVGNHSFVDVPRQTPPKTAPLREIAVGTPLAVLSIPRIRLSAIVRHGSDERTLHTGLGHVEQTAWIARAGNVVIAGHRDTFFRPLRNVRVGDNVFLTTEEGRVEYQVTSFRVVKSNDLSVLRPTSNATLTLVTCYPFWVLGPAPDRFVVFASRVDQPELSTVHARADIPQAPARTPALQVSQRDAGPPAVESRSSMLAEDGAIDDQARVRQAIERFRATYNARLATHGRPDAAAVPLVFRGCGVSLADVGATATCDPVNEPSDASLERTVWTFTLEKAGDGWAIRSLSTN
jgi:sortase A